MKKNGEWKIYTFILHSPFTILNYFEPLTLFQYIFAACSVLFGPYS